MPANAASVSWTGFRARAIVIDVVAMIIPLQEQLMNLAREHPRYGYRRLHVMLRRGGEVVNHKRVSRVYRDLGLSVKRTKRKRLRRTLKPRPVLTKANQEWAIDFASDVAAGGQRLRVFSVVDAYTREY